MMRMKDGSLMERTSADDRRREQERRMVQEGLQLLRQKKQDQWQQRVQEQKEMRDMLSKYSPWGRPGCGAPNPDGVRKRKLRLEGLYPENEHKGTSQQVRQSNGVPVRARSGQMSAGFRSDPQIHFQSNEQGRRCVDVLRYRRDPSQQMQYRQELDAIVSEKRRLQLEEMNRSQEKERQMGWSDESTLKSIHNHRYSRFSNNHINSNNNMCNGYSSHNGHVDEDASGVELVPLLARRRVPAASRHPLTTTDVTKVPSEPSISPRVWLKPGNAYIQELSRQVVTKQQEHQRAVQEDRVSSQKHHDTWRQFWGRPGHGAPREVTVKSNIDVLLRQLPVK